MNHSSPSNWSAWDTQLSAADSASIPDRFCSSSLWQRAAHAAFAEPGRQSHCWRTQEAMLALTEPPNNTATEDRCWLPHEAVWGFASTAVGKVPQKVGHDVAALLQEHIPLHDQVLLSGIQDSEEGQIFIEHLLRDIQSHFIYKTGISTQRRHLPLAQAKPSATNPIPMLGRSLQRSLHRASRRAQKQGVRFVCTQPSPQDLSHVLTRIWAIEHNSWKGIADVGIASGSMQTFYAHMLPRLALQQNLICIWAMHNHVDVGYWFGSRCGNILRGLQCSFIHTHAEFSIGNLLQQEAIQWGLKHHIATYDLGQDASYKARWAPTLSTSHSLFLYRKK